MGGGLYINVFALINDKSDEYDKNADYILKYINVVNKVVSRK